MNKVFLGIGTNLGNRKKNLKEVIVRIEEYIGHVVKTSSVYLTEPWGFQTRDEFFNMVVEVETRLTPYGLLGRILMIESLSGRVKGEKQYSSRVIDIDILIYEDIVIDDKSLKIPHPLMHERKFVLIPLCEIEPEIIHPILSKSVESLLQSCNDTCNVKKLTLKDYQT